MEHRVYLRDWYFNAGVIGFLTISADDKGLNSIPSLSIGENFIEFDNNIFEGFEQKFRKYAFLKFFNTQVYLKRLQDAHKDIVTKKAKTNTEQIVKKIEEIEKSPYKDFLRLLNIQITNYEGVDDFVVNLKNAITSIKELSKLQIFERLNNSPEGKESLDNFIGVRFKGVCSYESILEYMDKIKTLDNSKQLKNNDLCPSCQERKAEYEFNNAVSNIIGFNKDNSNWIWGYKSSNLKVCSLCALLYSCAFASFSYILKKVDKNYLNYFYFANENTNAKSLFEMITKFNLVIENIADNSNILCAMVKQTVEHVMAGQSKSIAENINFIEIVDNPILKGQSSRGYNIYNYNIVPTVAKFLDSQFKDDKIPKGYYKIKSTYYSIDEELLKLAIGQQIDYTTLYKYFAYYLNSERYGVRYNLNRVTSFVINYIQWIGGEGMDGKGQQIVKKGFKSGINLRDKLLKKEKENQINGIVYGFLNDLKIADREKFLDKYIRVMMSNDQPILFGTDEMLDNDYFLQFGYSFINGLMSRSTENKNTNEIKEEK
jgi:CRISPR-associated protein Cst1